MVQAQVKRLAAGFWSLSHASVQLLQKPLGVIKGDIGSSMGVSLPRMGWLDFSLLFPFAIVQVALRASVDRVGPRKAIGVALFGASVLMFTFGWWSSYGMFMLLLFLAGSLESIIMPSCVKALSTWHSGRGEATQLGLWGSSLFVGQLLATTMAVWFRGVLGWRHVFVVPSILTALVGVLVFRLLRMPSSTTFITPLSTTHASHHKKHDRPKPTALSSVSSTAPSTRPSSVHRASHAAAMPPPVQPASTPAALASHPSHTPGGAPMPLFRGSVVAAPSSSTAPATRANVNSSSSGGNSGGGANIGSGSGAPSRGTLTPTASAGSSPTKKGRRAREQRGKKAGSVLTSRHAHMAPFTQPARGAVGGGGGGSGPGTGTAGPTKSIPPPATAAAAEGGGGGGRKRADVGAVGQGMMGEKGGHGSSRKTSSSSVEDDGAGGGGVGGSSPRRHSVTHRGASSAPLVSSALPVPGASHHHHHHHALPGPEVDGGGALVDSTESLRTSPVEDTAHGAQNVVRTLLMKADGFLSGDYGASADEESESEGEVYVLESMHRSHELTLLEVLRLPHLLSLGLIFFFVNMIRFAVHMWLPFYFQSLHSYNRSEAGYLSGVFELGGLIGSLLIGIAGDRFAGGRKAVTCQVSLLVGAVSTVMFHRVASGSSVFQVLFLLIMGACYGGVDVLISTSMAISIGIDVDAVTSVVSVISCFGTLGGFIQAPLIALVVRHHGARGGFYLLAVMVTLPVLASFLARPLDKRKQHPLLGSSSTRSAD